MSNMHRNAMIFNDANLEIFEISNRFIVRFIIKFTSLIHRSVRITPKVSWWHSKFFTFNIVLSYLREQVNSLGNEETSDGRLYLRRRMVAPYQFEERDENRSRVRRVIDPRRYDRAQRRWINAFAVEYPTGPKATTHALKHAKSVNRRMGRFRKSQYFVGDL